MARTINGLTMKEIMEKLQADFDKSVIKERDYDGVKYIGVDDYRERLNEVVGVEHYNELYDEVKVIVTKDTYTTSTKCRLELLDDNYEVILVKESAGGSIIAFPKINETVTTVDDKFIKHENAVKTIKDGKQLESKVVGTTTTSIPNDIDSACQDAFKRICKKGLGIGKKQLDEAKKVAPIVVLLKDCKPNANGNIYGKVEYNGTTVNFAVFKSSVDAFKKAYGSDTLRNKTIAFYGKEQEYNGNPQLVFNKAAEVPTSQNVSNTNTAPKTTNATTNNSNASVNNAPKPVNNTTTSNEQKSNNEISKLEIQTTGLLTAYPNKDGMFTVEGMDRKNKQYKLYCSENSLSNSKDWVVFKSRAGSTSGIRAIFTYQEVQGFYQVKDIVLQTA